MQAPTTGPAAMRAKPPQAPSLSRQEIAKSRRMAQLITAAEDIFLSKGYHTATMSDVAKAAHMSKKTVYQLVESKAELFIALLSYQQFLLTYPAEAPDWSISEILVQNLLSLARFLLSPKQIAILRLIMAEFTHSPDLGRAFHQKRVVKARNRLEICLAEITERQGITLPDIHELSAMLFGMAIGEFHLAVLIGFRAPPTLTALERRIRQAVEIALSGCAK